MAIIVVTFAICFGVYQASKRHHCRPNNVFAPFTWQIEGLKKPQKVLSNAVRVDERGPETPWACHQRSCGTPTSRSCFPTSMCRARSSVLPAIEAGDDPAAMNHPVKTSGTSIGALGAIPLSQPAMISEKAGIGTSATVGLKKTAPVEGTEPVRLDAKVPAAPADEVAAEPVPRDPAADAKRAAAAEVAALAAEVLAGQSPCRGGGCRGARAAGGSRQRLGVRSPRGEGGQGCGRPGAQGCARGWCRTAAAPEKAAGTASDAGATKGGDAADGAAGTAGADDAGAAKGVFK